MNYEVFVKVTLDGVIAVTAKTFDEAIGQISAKNGPVLAKALLEKGNGLHDHEAHVYGVIEAA